MFVHGKRLDLIFTCMQLMQVINNCTRISTLTILLLSVGVLGKSSELGVLDNDCTHRFGRCLEPIIKGNLDIEHLIGRSKKQLMEDFVIVCP